MEELRTLLKLKGEVGVRFGQYSGEIMSDTREEQRGVMYLTKTGR